MLPYVDRGACAFNPVADASSLSRKAVLTTMVTRSKPKRPQNGTLFAFAGGTLVVVTAVLAVRHSVYQAEVPSCVHRYETAEVLSMRDNGARKFSVADLQARLSGNDWGLMQHARVVARDGDRRKLGLRIALPAGAEHGGRYEQPGSGAGFTWLPRRIKGANAACLSYDVKLGADFSFDASGVLPGLVARDERTGEVVLSFPLAWLESRQAAVRLQRTNKNQVVNIPAGRRHFVLPRNRWVSLDQEVILNTPGRANGVVRLWVNGALWIEKTGLILRQQSDTVLVGVRADTHYVGSVLHWAAAPKATEVDLSPFVVRQ